MFLSTAMTLVLGGALQAAPASVNGDKAGVAQLYAECAGYYDFIGDSQESNGKKQSAEIMRGMARNAVLISLHISAANWRTAPDSGRMAANWERDAITPHRQRIKLLLNTMEAQDDPSMREEYASKCAGLTEMTDVLLKSLGPQAPGK